MMNEINQVCAAGMMVLADTFGSNRAFEMQTIEVNASGPMSPLIKMHPPFRRFASFEAAAMECAMSRVYLGIHFRYDSIAGNVLGNNVGRYVLEKALVPVQQ